MMNLKNGILVGVTLLGSLSVSAKNKEVTGKYERSSLAVMLLETSNFKNKALVVKDFSEAPFPEKYNNHNIGISSIDPTQFNVAKGDKGVSKEPVDLVFPDRKNDIPTIEAFLKKEDVAKKMVAKWFDRQANGAFDVNLVSERGLYNATILEKAVAENSARGVAALQDAGENLIPKTFLVVSKMNFVENSTIAAVAYAAAKTKAAKITNPIAKKSALMAAEAAFNKMKEGYSVWTVSYLYQLNWNEEVAQTFYSKYWMDGSNLSAEKKAAFDHSNLFSMKYVGNTYVSSLVTFSLKDRSKEETIQLATVRNIDKIYAKLQKEYDAFQVMTPLLTVKPCTAKIGMKEGLTGKEKFQVLEQIVDEATGKVHYKVKGTISLNKSKIWDNRYQLAENKEELDATYFKGGKKFYPGMLLKQIK
ncbi:hypothetical protein K4L44_04945 [Halosquirtibacter laminarini]|uniref:Uncharacterized protein n=1 Tax=Halosquirtibacter laminarini TaxID=3374600 RepID=A0AC61NHM4_9BACT|nr:hypothetical protein K4L44_04945 [Prolixibacteraceae bacterium]